uniref:cGMP-dependent protein kinase n=1 Tax=Rhabditophanes sp. KR3021 TaxID=114890 RepID=A0AC35UFX9_9BILA
MNCFSFCRLCSKPNTTSRNKNVVDGKAVERPSIDTDSTYGNIDSVDAIEDNVQLNNVSPAKGISFRAKAKNVIFGCERFSHQNTPIRDDSKKQANRKSFPIFSSTKKQDNEKRKLPKLPVPSPSDNSTNNLNVGAANPKKLQTRQVSYDDKGNEVYESIYPEIETDSIVDPFYSKLNEPSSSQKYDSSVFSKFCKKNMIPVTTQDDPIYTSASQIYGGSEDPYSSIISNSGDKDTHGYSRVKDTKSSDDLNDRIPMVDEDVREINNGASTSHVPINLEALYAKINRPKERMSNGFRCQKSTDSGVHANTSPNKNNETPSHDLIYQQMDESGSESIISSNSRNPSYRYITVRETVDVVRERIRRQQEEGSQQNIIQINEGPPPIREHYYSSINEYESVSDAPTDNLQRNGSGAANYLMSENQRPIPPISPVPERYGVKKNIYKPRIVNSTTYPSMQNIGSSPLRSINIQQIGNSRSHSMAEISNSTPIKKATIRTISIQLTDSKKKIAEDEEILKRGFSASRDSNWSTPLDHVISIMTEFMGEPAQDILEDSISLISNIVTTGIEKAKELNESKCENKTILESGSQTDRFTSQIPRKVVRKASFDAETQTSRKVFQEIRKKSLVPNVGNRDYVSTIDLSNEKGWPLKNGSIL